EISMRTPCARSFTIRPVRSSWSVMARRSCISTCTVTNGKLPIFKIGIRSMSFLRFGCRRLRNAGAGALQRHQKGIRERRLGDDLAQIDAKMHNRLGDLRSDSTDNAISAHEPRGGDSLQEMLGDQRVYRRHSGDVD